MGEFDKAAALIRDAQVIILDVDDNLYPRDLSLHRDIKRRICRNANETNILGRKIQLSDLGQAFPVIAGKILERAGEDGLRGYFDDVYDVDYGCLARDDLLITGIARLKLQSKRFIAYTNGPASGNFLRPLHFETVVECLGLPTDTFTPTDVYDLTRMIRSGFGKPTVESALHMLDACGVPAGTRAVFIDDGIDNLAAFRDPRIAARNPVSTIWSHAIGGPAHGTPVVIPATKRHVVDATCASVGQLLAEASCPTTVASSSPHW